MRVPKTVKMNTSGPEVWDMQARLNHLKASFNELTVDGVFGRNTDARVREFQARNGLMEDGICGGQSWSRLLLLSSHCRPPAYTGPKPGTAPTTGAAKPDVPLPANASAEDARRIAMLREGARHPSVPAGASDLLDELVTNHFPDLKVILAAASLASEPAAAPILRGLMGLKAGGLTVAEIAGCLRYVGSNAKLATLFSRSTPVIMDALAKGGPKFVGSLKYAKANKLGILGAVIGIVEGANYFRKGKYHQGAGEIYGGFMGCAVPIGGLIDAVQTLLNAVSPGLGNNPNVRATLLIIQWINPIGWGKIGVDWIMVEVELIVTLFRKRKIDMRALERFAQRVRTSPMSAIVAQSEAWGDYAGDKGGDLFYEYVLKNTDFFD